MSHFEDSWEANDGLMLYAQGWLPDGKIKAVICLVHGLGEHSGRYRHVAETLNQAGYAMIAADLRGHGRSAGRRGHSPSVEALMDDIALLASQAQQRFPEARRFHYGHSLGGLLTLHYILRRQPQAAGVVVSGPGFFTPLTEQRLKIALVKALGPVFPEMSLPSGLDPAVLSRDPAVVRAYIDDPLVHDRVTLKMASSTIPAIHWTLDHASEFKLPLLVMHGGADQAVYPRGSLVFTECVSQDCTLKIWDGLFHEIHNEPEKEQVLAYLVKWLDQHL